MFLFTCFYLFIPVNENVFIIPVFVFPLVFVNDNILAAVGLLLCATLTSTFLRGPCGSVPGCRRLCLRQQHTKSSEPASDGTRTRRCNIERGRATLTLPLSVSVHLPTGVPVPPSVPGRQKPCLHGRKQSEQKIKSESKHERVDEEQDSDPILYIRNIILKELRSLIPTVMPDPVSDYFHCVLCSFCATRLRLCSS